MIRTHYYVNMDQITDKTTVTSYVNDKQTNVWEALETHMHLNLGVYGLEMFNTFLHLKELAEDKGMCPEDTEERQQIFTDYNG